MTAITQPFYNIWIRTLDPTPLYSRWDPTQARAGKYNPSLKPPSNPAITGEQKSMLPRGFKRIALITSYEKLEFKTKYNNVGGWTLLMQDGTTEANLLKELCFGKDNANYIEQGGYGGITVIRDGKIIFSGSVRGFEATGDFYAEHGPMIEFWGVDDTGYLENRLTMVPAPGNQQVPNTPNNAPYYTLGPLYSGRQIYTENNQYDYSGTYVPPVNQGWGYYRYPNVSGYDKVFRSVTAGLRHLAQLNIGVYAPYPYTYPFTYVVDTGIHYAQVVKGTRPAILYNAIPFSQPYTPRRIPFLFCGKTNNPNNAYINNLDSNQGDDDQSVVPPFIMRARYETLLEKCQEIASFTTTPLDYNNLPAYRGYQFSINQDEIEVTQMLPDGTDKITKIDGLRFNYKQPAQKENTVIFSESLGNLGSYKFSFTQQTSNYVIAAGQGESTLRWFVRQRSANVQYGLTANQFRYGLREKLIDRRDVQYGDDPATLPVASIPHYPTPNSTQRANYNSMIAEMKDAIDVVLRDEGTIVNLELNLLNVPSTRYFVDYFVGDWVTVRIGNQNIIGQITDVTISLTRDGGEVINATVGTQPIGDNFMLFNSIKQNKENITRLEISQ